MNKDKHEQNTDVIKRKRNERKRNEREKCREKKTLPNFAAITELQ